MKTGIIFLLRYSKFMGMINSIRKFVLPLLGMAIITVSCSSSKNATTVKRNDVKGSWRLDRINYEGLASSERLRLVLLDEGNEACLTGSAWSLPNNGYGTYTINAAQSGCTQGEKKIVWSYREENNQPIFQFKKLQEGEKAKNITEGYRFKILSASDQAMVLQSEISYQGKPIFINYSFVRN
jgi:hypothetical protein